MVDKRRPLILTLEPVDAAAAPETPAAATAPLERGFARRSAVPQTPKTAPETPPDVLDLQPPPPPPPIPPLPLAELRAAGAAASAPPPAQRRSQRPLRKGEPGAGAIPTPSLPASVPRRRSRREAAPIVTRWAYPAAAAGSVLWAGGMVAFIAGYEHGALAFDYAPFRYVVAAGLALLPAALMFVFAYMLRQSARLADEARKTRHMADDLSLPAALAGAKAAGAVGRMREEITRAQSAADEAGQRMTALHTQLAEETRLINEAALQAERSASRLGGRLQAERAELASLSGQLDAQLASAAEGAARHARLAAEASDLAGANLQEAQASLAGRTADLVAAAGDAGRAAGLAGDNLAQEGDRLLRLSAALEREQAAWAEAARALLTEEEDVSARLESSRARLSEASAEAQAGARAVHAAAGEGSQALSELAAEAVRQAQAVVEAADLHAEQVSARAAAARAEVEADTQAALNRLSAAAAAAREEAAAAAEAARLRVEGLAEAAFAVGQRADQAFDSRLSAARRAIEAQASLVEDAGLRSAARIEAGVEAVRAALGEAAGLATEVDRRFSALPAAVPGPTSAAAPVVKITPPRAVAAAPAPPAEAPEELKAEAVVERLTRLIRELPPEPEAPAAPPPADPSQLRPRLRLAATEGDESLFAAPKAAPAAAPPPSTSASRPAPASDPTDVLAWSWKDLLTSMDDAPPLDDEALAERMIGEIAAMGVDTGALLPRSRIDEIARAVDSGDAAKAREAVRRLAPAAVRRLSRRVLTDKVLRGQADAYRRRYGELVRDQARGAGQDGSTSLLLGSDPGRAFLLLDAAVGDLH